MAEKTKLLIETVKQYPCLYDVSDRNYINKSKRYKNKIWSRIADVIGEKDSDTVKAKWKNLRDAYSKHVRSEKIDAGQSSKLVERYRSWPWSSHMSFLRPCIKQSSRSVNNTKENVNEDIKEESSSQSQEADPLQQSPKMKRRKQANMPITQVDNESTEFLQKYNTNTKTGLDETDLIFWSYSQTIKRMSKRRQATVKFQIAKIIMEAELEQLEESSSSMIRDSLPVTSSNDDDEDTPDD